MTSINTRAPSASSAWLSSMTNPRVMISGTPSSAPVCLLIATTGTKRLEAVPESIYTFAEEKAREGKR